MQATLLAVFVCLSIALARAGEAASPTQTINLDGNGPGRIFDGIGGLSAGANSRLLHDYPEPQRSQILDFLFKPDFGASLQILKVEIGGDVWTTWGSEPSFAVSREEFDHPKPEYYQRGYEWWLMQEARKRNPNIILEGLQWGAPGWIGNGQFFSLDNALYIARFIKAAHDYYGVDINYQGIRNECGWDIGWVKTLRKTLDASGLKDVKISLADGVANWCWPYITKDLESDPEFEEIVASVGAHYPGYKSPDEVKDLGKPLWDGEDGVAGPTPWARANAYARIYNHNYVEGRFIQTVICALITSNYDYLVPWGMAYCNDIGLTKACTPWSGHYEVSPSIWVTAHTTQFTKPGWRYLNGGCGLLEGVGSYVTLRSPDQTGDYSIIIETMKDTGYQNMDGVSADVSARTLTFDVKNLSDGPIHVWRSNKTEQFVKLPDMVPQNGSFEITVDGNSVYSLTTTTGQHKGSYAIPKASPFPFPYSDDFEGYAPGTTPKYLCDQDGTFEVARRSDGSGNCLRQIVPKRGLEWNGQMEWPWTIIGDADWNDYDVSCEVRVPKNGFGGIYGRVDGVLVTPVPAGYGLTIDSEGAWQLKDTKTVIESGNIRSTDGSWHNLRLRFKGNHVIAEIDGTVMASIVDDFHAKGAAALVSSYDGVEFDDLSVRPFKGAVPKPAAEWENLAVGKKASASSEAWNTCTAKEAVDGNHTTFWSPKPSKTNPEWLEVDLGKETAFDRIVVDQRKQYQYLSGISDYKIQYLDGANWKDLAFGTSPMGVRQAFDFPEVVAQRIRLLVTAHEENFCVYELEVEKNTAAH